MNNSERITFLCSEEIRRELQLVSNALERNRSDTLRWLIRRAAEEVQEVSSSSGQIGQQFKGADQISNLAVIKTMVNK